MQKLNILPIICCILLCGTFAQAQNNTTEKPFELGLNLVAASVNSGWYSSRPLLTDTYFSGIFMRYNKGKIGLRAGVNYFQKNYKSCENCFDGMNGVSNMEIFTVKIGGQYAILKNKKWLYTYLDAAYQNEFTTGELYGGMTGKAYTNQNTTNRRLQFVPGVGCQLNLFRTLYLSPEIGYAMSFDQITDNSLYTDRTDKFYTTAGRAPQVYNFFTHYLTAQLLLSVKF